jgi:5S rRNA maturation endonuclease (ribonuclease M5)
VTLEEAIRGVRATNRNVMVKCPAHDDRDASLAVSPGTDQPVTLHCHAGCEPEDVIREANLDWSEVCKPLEPKSIAPTEYTYTDEAGGELFQALRFAKPGGKKDFRQRHRGVDGQWVWNLNGVRRVLYRLPRVVEAVRTGRDIYVVEGEKDVHTMEALGFIATCNPMGAGKWSPEYTETLRGSRVFIIMDNDKPGRTHGRAVKGFLEEAECTVTLLETDLPNCKDVTDHVQAGGTIASLIDVTVTEEAQAGPAYGMDLLEFVQSTFSEESFVIPGTLAHQERVVLTGFEGHGKSTLMRQIAVCVAAGIHPFTGREMPPKRVMVLDAENGPRQMHRSWSRLVGLAAHHGHPVQSGMLRLLVEYLSQPDLTSIDGREWLFERVTAYRPDLIVLGPVQNLTARDVKDDDIVRRFKRTIDEARTISDAAVIMEHHAPHRFAGDKKRSVRPYGSSLWMKWPDFGYGLLPTDEEQVYEFERTRFPRERSRRWPEALRWGKENSVEWPWVETVIGAGKLRSV